MKKIWIVLKSEFCRRATSRGFILTTLLTPLGLLSLGVFVAAVTFFALESSPSRVAVLDRTGVLYDELDVSGKTRFIPSDAPVDSVRKLVRNGTYDGYLHLPETLLKGTGSAVYYSADGSGITTRMQISRQLNRAVQQQRLATFDVSSDLLAVLNAEVKIETMKLTDDGETRDMSQINAIVGYVMGFLIYITVFLYGGYVMQGVIEEKANRIVELIVSSVKPFELLMGKVLGIGALGLAQITIWSLLIFMGVMFAGSAPALFAEPTPLNGSGSASQKAVLDAADLTLPAVGLDVLVWSILFFMGGYLLYASLFAAVGSAVDQQQDAQSFIAPLTAFTVVPMVLIPVLVQNPNTGLSIVLSMIPFFSPILMVVRVAVVDVPLWQVGLSYLLLTATFVGAVWVSSRIYRVGILMYGKKPSLREMIRWVRYR